MAAAHGGQVVCSHTTAELARDALPSDVTLVELGEHRLRDLARPEEVFQVNGAGLGVSKQAMGSYQAGFLLFAALAVIALAGLTSIKNRWRTTWGAVGATTARI